MFPISETERLSLAEIAGHWKSELAPPQTFDEVFTHLSKAWWRGEFGPSEAARRLNILALIYNKYQNRVGFVIAGVEEPEMWRPPARRRRRNPSFLQGTFAERRSGNVD